MHRTTALRPLTGTLALAAAVAGLMLGTTTPVGAEVRPDSLIRQDVEHVADLGAQAVFEIHCYYANSTQILLSPYADCEHAGAYGVAELRRRSGGYRIEICNFSSPWLFYETIDPANPDGSSSGNLLWYSDTPGGGCYIRDIGYPVRKFRAEWNTYITDWDAPPS